MMLAPNLHITWHKPNNEPGRSAISISISVVRPPFIKPRLITRLKIVTSMLPPLTMQHTFLPAMSTLLNMAAATLTAPAPSAISLCCSIRANMAAHISSSVTLTMSSTYCCTISKVLTPGSFTAMPSAMVSTLVSVSIWLWSTLFSMLGAPCACTPTTRTEGLSALTAKATPLASPPPPMGTNMTSMSGFSFSISIPTVPCPAMTCSSSKGWINVMCFSSFSCMALA